MHQKKEPVGSVSVTAQITLEAEGLAFVDVQMKDFKRRMVANTTEWFHQVALMRMGWTPPPEYFERPKTIVNLNVREIGDQFHVYNDNDELLMTTAHRWVVRALVSNQSMYRHLQSLIHANAESD